MNSKQRIILRITRLRGVIIIYTYQLMTKNTQNRGFTLIELLVVIAIIGILASVVLASLNTARDKGSDASVKQSLTSVRSQIALYYDNNGGTYIGACADPNVIAGMVSAQTAIAPVPTAGGLGDGDCEETAVGDGWAAWVNLKADLGNAWCIDSTGRAEVIVAQDSSAPITACP